MIFLRYLPAWPQQVWFFALALVDLLLHISLLHMKKSIFLLTALLTLALFTYFWKSGSAGSGLRLAPAPPEENAELREAWEKKMLADPNTLGHCGYSLGC
jgi:hypothetical protein